jgi:hypothetical protein
MRNAASPIAASALFALAAASAGAMASPGLEFGPEVEAEFLAWCDPAGDPSAAQAMRCRCLLERLQASLGMEAFIAIGGLGPAGFDTQAPAAARAARAACAMPPAEPGVTALAR